MITPLNHFDFEKKTAALRRRSSPEVAARAGADMPKMVGEDPANTLCNLSYMARVANESSVRNPPPKMNAAMPLSMSKPVDTTVVGKLKNGSDSDPVFPDKKLIVVEKMANVVPAGYKYKADLDACVSAAHEWKCSEAITYGASSAMAYKVSAFCACAADSSSGSTKDKYEVMRTQEMIVMGAGGGAAHFTGEIDRKNHTKPPPSTLRAHKPKPNAPGRVLLDTGSETMPVDLKHPSLDRVLTAIMELLPPAFQGISKYDLPPFNCSVQHEEVPEFLPVEPEVKPEPVIMVQCGMRINGSTSATNNPVGALYGCHFLSKKGGNRALTVVLPPQALGPFLDREALNRTPSRARLARGRIP